LTTKLFRFILSCTLTKKKNPKTKRKKNAKQPLLQVKVERLMYSAFESGGHEKLFSVSNGHHSLDVNHSKPSCVKIYILSLLPDAAQDFSVGLFFRLNE